MAERFGDFELLALLSADAALESFLAVPPGGGAQVVLRRLRKSVAAQAGARDTFLQDAQAAMQLQHPSIARVVAVGEVGHQPYLAQERVEGSSLETLIARLRTSHEWPLPPARALAIVQPLLEGLAAAHSQKPGVLHREVSPRNIFVTPDGRAVLTGFGLARIRRSVGLGIADAFLSPEQMHGRPLDAASDVFTAALVLFELTCGRLPALGSTGEIIARIGSGDLDAARAVREGLGPLAEVLDRALSARRDERYADGAAFSAALKALSIPTDAVPELAQWLTALPAATVAPPTAEPRVGLTAASSTQVDAAAPVPSGAAISDSGDPPNRRLGRTARFGLGLVVGLAAVWFSINSSGSFSTRALPPAPSEISDAVPKTFETEIISTPGDAPVRINGQRVGKTPHTFTAERDRVYQVTLSSDEGDTDFVVQNAKRVEVDLVVHRVTREERIAGSRPPSKDTTRVVEVDPPLVPPPPPVRASFKATAPATFTLERAHQVRVDDVPQLPLRAGLLREVNPGYRSGGPMPAATPKNRSLKAGSSMSAAERAQAMAEAETHMGPMRRGFKHLSLVLSRHPDSVVLNCPGPTGVNIPAVPSWAFVLSERTLQAIEAPPTFEFAGQGLTLARSSVVIVEGDNRFTVEGLRKQSQWKISVKSIAKEGSAPSAAVMKVMPRAAGTPLTIDGAAVDSSTIILEPESTHTISGANSLWLAVPTISGFEPSPLEVSVEAF